jgi:hypothetical protein
MNIKSQMKEISKLRGKHTDELRKMQEKNEVELSALTKVHYCFNLCLFVCFYLLLVCCSVLGCLSLELSVEFVQRVTRNLRNEQHTFDPLTLSMFPFQVLLDTRSVTRAHTVVNLTFAHTVVNLKFAHTAVASLRSHCCRLDMRSHCGRLLALNVHSHSLRTPASLR